MSALYDQIYDLASSFILIHSPSFVPECTFDVQIGFCSAVFGFSRPLRSEVFEVLDITHRLGIPSYLGNCLYRIEKLLRPPGVQAGKHNSNPWQMSCKGLSLS
jgi:hypothetical protein